jgi:NTP pyrophosphatase (non-canonical NTP hydrolase)
VKSGLTRLARPGPAPLANPQAIATTLSALTAEFSGELAQAIREAAQAKPSSTKSL